MHLVHLSCQKDRQRNTIFSMGWTLPLPQHQRKERIDLHRRGWFCVLLLPSVVKLTVRLVSDIWVLGIHQGVQIRTSGSIWFPAQSKQTKQNDTLAHDWRMPLLCSSQWGPACVFHKPPGSFFKDDLDSKLYLPCPLWQMPNTVQSSKVHLLYTRFCAEITGKI